MGAALRVLEYHCQSRITLTFTRMAATAVVYPLTLLTGDFAGSHVFIPLATKGTICTPGGGEHSNPWTAALCDSDTKYELAILLWSLCFAALESLMAMVLSRTSFAQRLSRARVEA